MVDKIRGLMRTHHCGELRKEDVGKEVVLCGWVNKYRDLGQLHFVDIRDKYGMTQLGFENYEGDLQVLKDLSLESVIMAHGLVQERPEAAVNANMLTGQVEVQVTQLNILSSADKERLPFLPHGQIEATEDLKLKYRYLDLRTKRLQEILSLRSRATMKTRQVLMEEGFIEVETPILYKSTPEGARDYVVPSRVSPGKVYALPQSPQTLKQLLMIGCTDKYFQISRCFRDEDLRADRQPEFTQVDIEVSFTTQEYMRNLSENLARQVYNMPGDFSLPVMSFTEAMRDYGSDKPDIRFGLKHMIVNDIFADSGFSLFKNMIEGGGLVKAMFVPASMGALARKQIDGFIDVVKPYGGKGVAWFKVSGEGRSGGISKFVDEKIYHSLLALEEGNEGDGVWLFVGDGDHGVAHASTDALRRNLGNMFNLHADGYHFLWVNDFPLLEWNEEGSRFVAMHHPFTMPKKDDVEDFMSGDQERLKNCRAEAYDLVCNGYEIGGGSMRIFDQSLQQQMFKVLGMGQEEIDRQFGFFVEALRYGTPPHGGIAFGLDRMIMLLAGTDNIRDVIAFPKTTSASCLMSQAPSIPGEHQLDELGLSWKKKS